MAQTGTLLPDEQPLTARELEEQVKLVRYIDTQSSRQIRNIVTQYPRLLNREISAFHFGGGGPRTPFLHAVVTRNIEMVRLLIDLGARIRAEDIEYVEMFSELPPNDVYRGMLRLMLEERKTKQEGKEAQIAALNSTTLGQKLPEDIIRKVSEYGGRKRKTRKGKKSNKRKTYRK